MLKQVQHDTAVLELVMNLIQDCFVDGRTSSPICISQWQAAFSASVPCFCSASVPRSIAM